MDNLLRLSVEEARKIVNGEGSKYEVVERKDFYMGKGLSKTQVVLKDIASEVYWQTSFISGKKKIFTCCDDPSGSAL